LPLGENSMNGSVPEAEEYTTFLIYSIVIAVLTILELLYLNKLITKEKFNESQGSLFKYFISGEVEDNANLTER
jgi:hypothetical protein